MDIDLLPCVVQTMSRILKNRHPKAIVTLPCLNSLFLWSNRVSGHMFHYYNALGDSFRYTVRNISIYSTSIFSQNVTSEIVDQAVQNHDADVLIMKAKVENMWKDHGEGSKRMRRTIASTDAPGHSLVGDNVGNNLTFEDISKV